MKIIEFLAAQLDRDISQPEIASGGQVFVQNLDFWNLCLECRRLLLDERALNDTDKPG
jgi:hypothetical protein